MISEAFASELKAGRNDFNARFAEARRRFPGLSADLFKDFLRIRVDAVVSAVGAVKPEKVAETAYAAYDVSLELTGQGLVGSSAKHHDIETGWQRLLPAASPWVAEDPVRVLSAVSNALHYLAASPGARPIQWIDDMEKAATLCGSADEFLRFGQVVAWRAGLAHLRSGALKVADSLPVSLAKAALGAPAASVWAPMRSRLENDPWFNPMDAAQVTPGTGSRLRVALRAGAFRGFGGLFPEPPRVTALEEHFLVTSGKESWLLVADIFGATFHRAFPVECAMDSPQMTPPSGITITETTICKNGISLDFPDLGSFTSIAANDHTLAFTSPLTHAVVLVALT